MPQNPKATSPYAYHVKWVAAHFAFDLAHYIEPIWHEETIERDDTADREAREAALTKAVNALGVETEEGFEPLPPAWVKARKRNRRAEDYWTNPERSFDGQFAAKCHFAWNKDPGFGVNTIACGISPKTAICAS